MNRVKKIEDVIIGGGDVLVEMIEKSRESGIVLPNATMKDDQSSSFGIVVAIGAEVKDIEVGDIILKTRVSEAPAYEYKDKALAMFNRYNIAVAIKPSNFDNNEELTS